MDPNTDHQLWSRWTFKIHGKPVPFRDVEVNASRWLRRCFGSVGRAKVEEVITNGSIVIVVTAEVEGAQANDPRCIELMRKNLDRFVSQGWGPTAYSLLDVEILAGDREDGKPPAQLVVMPGVDV